MSWPETSRDCALGEWEDVQVLTIVGIIALYEAPAVDVDDLASAAPVAAKHIKTADHLPESVTDASRPLLLLVV